MKMNKSQDVAADPCLHPYEEANELLKIHEWKQLYGLFFVLFAKRKWKRFCSISHSNQNLADSPHDQLQLHNWAV